MLPPQYLFVTIRRAKPEVTQTNIATLLIF